MGKRLEARTSNGIGHQVSGGGVRAAGAWLAPALVPAFALAMIAVASGGYLPRSWRLGTVAFLALSCAALLARERIALGRLEWWFLAGLTAMGGWTAASHWWSDQPATSVLEAERGLLYLTGCAAVLLIVQRAQLARLLGGVLAGITAVSAYGLAEYSWPGRPLNPIQGKLLFEPLGYANAFGIFAAIGILLAVGLGTAASPGTWRPAALATLAVLVPTLYLTSSRGASLALVAGLAVLLGARRPSRRLALLLAGGAIASVAAVAATSSDTGIAARLLGENRPRYWRVAWEQYQSSPTLGTGAGTFSNYWLHLRPVSSFARDAHSLYVEALAELGPVGLLLLLATLAVPLVAFRRVRDPIAAAALAGYVAFLVHAGVDWDWEVPAVSLAGLVCGASILVAARPADAATLPRGTRAGLLAAGLVLAALAVTRVAVGPRLPFAP
jgi:O-antigen ligase